MKHTLMLLVILILVPVACSSPEERPISQQQATAISGVATVMGSNSIPTSTPASTASVRPVSTSTAIQRLTGTPKPPLDNGAKIILQALKSMFIMANDPIEIMGVSYEDGPHGERTILHIEAKYTAEPYKDIITPAVLGGVMGFIRGEMTFEPLLYSITVTSIDNNMNCRSLDSLDWKDLVDLANKKITTDQLFLRITRIP